MEQIQIRQNDIQEISINSNIPQLIKVNNINQENINVTQNNAQDINITNRENQIIYIDDKGTSTSINDVLVNGVSVVNNNVAYVIVPTKLSELQNNVGFITNESDPTVPMFIKQITLTDINNWNNKQNLLISGTNIKTINNNSLLGSGNLTINPQYTAGTGINITNATISNTIVSYEDLSDTPYIPEYTGDLINNSNFVSSNELAEVAFNGSYNALSNTPIIPDSTSELTNDSGFIDKNVNDLTYYTLTSNLSSVATSGSYNDLTNTPTIPVVNDGTLTIQQNNTTLDTFTANSSSNKTININTPTLTSELTNNSGFITNNVNNLTNYTDTTTLTSMFNDFLKVEEVSTPIGAIAPQAGLYDQTYTFTIPSGYTPIGILGFRFTGSNSISLSLAKCYIDSSNRLYYSIWNTRTSGSSSDSSSTLKAQILFKKL